MGEPVITVENLGKRYLLAHEQRHDTLRDTITQGARGLLRRWTRQQQAASEEFWAVRDVSFSVNRGEVIGIIGRNGAGKSTLLKILSRITEPTQGRVRIRGRVASLLEVGTGFHPELSGRENVFLNGAILGMRRAEIRAKFDEIVAFAEVERFLDTPVKHYSSGMYVRLAFAVAAHLEPEILIVDEVLAVGDADFQAKCLGKMESVAQQEGRTILFVSHNIAAVARFCQRGILLDHGRVALDGRTDLAINGYVSAGRGASDAEVELSREGHVSQAPLRLLSLALNSSAPLVNRRPFTATLRFTADKPLAGVGFGLGFCNIDGRRVVTLESDYHGQFIPVSGAGEHVVQVSFPVLDLVPGRYRVDVGAYGTGHESYHYAPDCAVIDVQPGSATPQHLQGTYGDWRPPSDWRLISG
ncbi:MAG TPA: ABC transporter ATP-binding protein [Opitutaceae bacterium]|nr:ABC transporter ATP-binding protein [Opitutaceae bacterium]